MNSKSLIIILCLLTSALIAWQLILPNYEKIKTSSQEVEQVKQRVQKLENLTAKLKDLSFVYKEKEDSINKLYKILPKEKNIPWTLDQYEKLSFQSGMILNSLDFAEVETKKTKQALAAPEQESGKSAVIAQGVSPTAADNQAAVQANEYETLSVSFRLSGTYEAFRGFLDNLEHCIRLADVQSISFSFKGEGSDFADFSVTANIYYK